MNGNLGALALRLAVVVHMFALVLAAPLLPMAVMPAHQVLKVVLATLKHAVVIKRF
jgi:hypothetical protein